MMYCQTPDSRYHESLDIASATTSFPVKGLCSRVSDTQVSAGVVTPALVGVVGVTLKMVVTSAGLSDRNTAVKM